ncbi:MAG: cyclase family protein [Candidatus Nanohaloarchaea archaeon]
MEIIDVSMEISEDMIYYPGNPQPEIERYRQIPEDSTTESKVCFGSHTGTHVDAPQHVKEDGESVEELDLENFYGRAQVLNLTDCKEKVDREDLENTEITEKIVLLKTDNSLQGYEEFREDFTYLTLEGVEYLIEQGVKTVGIDYLSLVNFEDSEKADRAHRKANQEMTVIEGLNLQDTEPGKYTFSGMPLKMNTDGAPMRAVLITKQS